MFDIHSEKYDDEWSMIKWMNDTNDKRLDEGGGNYWDKNDGVSLSLGVVNSIGVFLLK